MANALLFLCLIVVYGYVAIVSANPPPQVPAQPQPTIDRERALRRSPFHIVAAVTVDEHSISQDQPCGLGGHLSVVASTDLLLFDNMAKRLLEPNGLKDITIEFRDKMLCAARHGDDFTGGYKDLTQFNLKCHTRRRFGGCTPLDVLHPETSASLPRSTSQCTSHRAFLPEDHFFTLKDSLFTPPVTADEEELTFNVTEAIEQKTWVFYDGKTSKHLTTRFVNGQPLTMFGSRIDEFVEHETNGRFLLYLCQGVVYPEPLPTPPKPTTTPCPKKSK